ncbi:MAG: hypothetical protein FWE43_02890, partial [Streptococcaceae bacterium]|nr:hypothetical protein [Streptococcaceae bacterium]
MKNWKKVVLLLMPILALTVLAGCSFGGDTASKNAKDDAQGVLDFVYKGDTASNFSDISTMSASDSKQYILDTWAQTQYDYFKSQGAPSDDFSFK